MRGEDCGTDREVSATDEPDGRPVDVPVVDPEVEDLFGEVESPVSVALAPVEDSFHCRRVVPVTLSRWTATSRASSASRLAKTMVAPSQEPSG